MMNRHDRLRARLAETLDALQGAGSPLPVPLPRGPNPTQQAALDVVLDVLPAGRADDLIDTWAVWHPRACVADPTHDPRLLELVTRPVAGLPRLSAARAALAAGRAAHGLPGWEPEGANLLELHDRSWLDGSHPPLGLSAWARPDLLERLEAGVGPDLLLDGHLAAGLVHTLCRGPARGWSGGWPCWTLIEAAVTHVHRRVAPAHILPDAPGSALPAYRHFAGLGAWLAAWLGEEAVWTLAGAAVGPHEGWDARAGTIFALADLQVWLARGGSHLGPAWSDPFAWLKLLSVALHGGPLDLRRLRPLDRVGPADCEGLPDLLQAASALDWHTMPVSRGDEAPDAGLLDLAVASMLVEDITLHTMLAAPSDPPAGELVLDVASCTLSARPRAHHQFTEPARALVPPAWCAGLRRQGLERLVLRGVRWEGHQAAVDALLGLAGPLPAALQLDLERRAPAAVPTPPAAQQVRQHDPILVLGCPLAADLQQRLRAACFSATPSPFGVTPDPLGAARALSWSCRSEALPREVLYEQDRVWRSRWHDPSWTWPGRGAAFADLDPRLARARAAARQLRLLVLCWETAHVEAGPGPRRLLQVDEIVQATRDALSELQQHVAAPRVLLLISPALDPSLSASDNHLGKAVLLLAARALGLDVLPAWEIFAQELRDPRGYAADGHRLSDAGRDLIFQRLLDVVVAPVNRGWSRALLVGASPAPTHPFLPLPAAEPAPTQAPAPELSEQSWRAELEALLAEEPPTDEQLPWRRRMDDIIELIGRLPGASERYADLLQALIDASDAIVDPDLLSPPCAVALRELLPEHDVAVTAPLLRTALQRRWVEDPAPLLAPLDPDRRRALGLALLDGRPAPRKGQPLRTPLERCLGLLLPPQ